MSYILDALKKSSDERRKHQAERQTSFPLPDDSPRRKEKRTGIALPLLLLLSILAAAATGSWIFYNMNSAAEKEQHTPDRDAGTSSAEIPDFIPGPKAPPPEQKSAAPMKPPSLSVSPSTAAIVTPDRPLPELDQNRHLVPLLEELPVRVRGALPEMKFSGHVYSPTPSLRMIMINTDIVREKETIAAGLRLLEITENGLILEFNATRFRVELF